MKKSSILIVLIILAFLAGAQNNSDLLKKVQRAHEKNSKIVMKSAPYSNFLNAKAFHGESPYFKSVTAKQKLDSTVTRILNSDTQAWEYDSKDEFIYDSNLKNTNWLSKEWKQTSNKWETQIITDLGYDSHNRVNSMIMSGRDSLNNEIIPYSKMVVWYNSEGMQDSTLSYFTEDAGVNWSLEMRQLNYYNSSKKLTRLDVWALDDESGEMVLSMNVVYTYTSSGKIKTSTTNYLMEGEEIPWSKMVHNYDGSDLLTSVEDWTLNFMTFTLEKTSRNSYQYNASGDVSVDTYSSWNGMSWVDEEKDESTYSTTNFSDVVFPTFIGLLGIGETTEFMYNKVLTGTNTFDMVNGTWKNTEKTVFYYSGGTSTNIDETNNALFNVFPNPAASTVSFMWNGNYERLTLEMYQSTGAKVLEQYIYPGRLVSISSLENGVYFYKLLNEQQTLHSGKLIKE